MEMESEPVVTETKTTDLRPGLFLMIGERTFLIAQLEKEIEEIKARIRELSVKKEDV